MDTTHEQLSEQEIRTLRNNIYGVGPADNNNWEGCKKNWMRPDSVEWLIEHQPK